MSDPTLGTPSPEPLSGSTLNGRTDAFSVVAQGLSLPPMRSAKNMPILQQPLQTGDGNLQIQVQGRDGVYQRFLTDKDYQQSLLRDPSNYAAGLTDYIYVELRGRGDKGTPLRKKFLINPHTIAVNYDVHDSESFTRGGWQIGVWGELGTVSISGWSAGRYFAGRLVDTNAKYSASYRDLQEVETLYENNGNFYEGELGASGLVPLDASRKQIQFHADVTLRFGNFVWDGYFTEMKVDDMADKPYVSKFTMGFQILRERYASTSPWRNSIVPEIRYRGHAYELTRKAKEHAAIGDRMATSLKAAALAQNNLLRGMGAPEDVPPYTPAPKAPGA